MLRGQCTSISYTAKFDLETLEEVFDIKGPKSKHYSPSADIAIVLLVIGRALLHKVSGGVLSSLPLWEV